MSKGTPLDQLSEAIGRELTVYSTEIVKGMKKAARKSMSDLVRETKATAPVGKRKDHYRDSIASKKEHEDERSVTYRWYVKGSDYRLSHLLENDHAKRGGGVVKGSHFIARASEPILADYEKAVEDIIKNG